LQTIHFILHVTNGPDEKIAVFFLLLLCDGEISFPFLGWILIFYFFCRDRFRETNFALCHTRAHIHTHTTLHTHTPTPTDITVAALQSLSPSLSVHHRSECKAECFVLTVLFTIHAVNPPKTYVCDSVSSDTK